MTKKEMMNAVIAYTSKDENKNLDGSINWNYVDADLWMDRVITSENQTEMYVLFNECADEIELSA